MGQAASAHDARHVRIWDNLNSLSSDGARLQMLNVLLSDQEYINSAKRAGIYADLLGWRAAVQRGEFYQWPRPYAPQAPPAMHRPPQVQASSLPPSPAMTRVPAKHAPQPAAAAPTLRITDEPRQRPVGSTALARIPPPKRALDYLHECYNILGLDDSKPLSHEVLRTAYKRAAIKVHPDKGGTPEEFDAVNRAFTYVQEVLSKLIPKGATDGDDPRFKMSVSPESALKARGDYVPGSVEPAPAGSLRIEDAPPIALNPKKLDMNLFNKLFEENKLPDPDKDDGYGDWLKSQDGRASSVEVMRGKYNKDMFNKMFEEEARGQRSAPKDALSKYKPPSDLTLAPGFGTELGSGRPDQYTKSLGSMSGGAGLAYTDLKHAYGEGSTFSQEVADVDLEGRPKTLEQAKRMYGEAPKPMSADEAAAVAAFDRARVAAEEQRRQRLAARDVDSETAYNRLKGRLMIQQ